MFDWSHVREFVIAEYYPIMTTTSFLNRLSLKLYLQKLNYKNQQCPKFKGHSGKLSKMIPHRND